MANSPPKKILLLSSDYHDQDSVYSISRNLYDCYARLKNTQTELVNIEQASFTIATLGQMDHVIIIHPLVVLSPMLKQIILKLNIHTKITFHIFGDYVRKSSVYLALNETLLGRNVTFLSASHAYKSLIDKSLLNGNSPVVPFPINEKEFFYSKKLRAGFRKKFGLKANQKVIIYSGRISPQKNILMLIEIFNQLKNENKAIALFIIGNVDDFEKPTFYEKEYLPGEYFLELSKLINKYKISDLFILPHVNAKELNQFYNGADSFISLSLYHDEDFGYAPIEALSTGCTAYLSSWGGYQDLKYSANSNQVNFAKVKFTKDTLSLSKQSIIADLGIFLRKKRIQRKKNASNFKEKYKVISIQKKLLSALNNKEIFEGFTDKFAIMALKMQTTQKTDILLYRYFYESFWKSL